MSVRDRSAESDDPIKRHRNRTTIIAVVFAVLLLLGAVFRALSGHEIVLTSLIYAPSDKVRYPGSRTPEDTAASFYLAIDNGDYERAYGMILEPRWTDETASYRDAVEAEGALFLGWTEEHEFLRRLKFEIGPGGSPVIL